MDVLSRLKSWSTTTSMFCSERCKNAGIAEMRALASQYNYDYSYYEKTGFWREIRAEPEAIPDTVLVSCEVCNSVIDNPKHTQRFCSQKCKNKFHNSKSK